MKTKTVTLCAERPAIITTWRKGKAGKHGRFFVQFVGDRSSKTEMSHNSTKPPPHSDGAACFAQARWHDDPPSLLIGTEIRTDQFIWVPVPSEYPE